MPGDFDADFEDELIDAAANALTRGVTKQTILNAIARLGIGMMPVSEALRTDPEGAP